MFLWNEHEYTLSLTPRVPRRRTSSPRLVRTPKNKVYADAYGSWDNAVLTQINCMLYTSKKFY